MAQYIARVQVEIACNSLMKLFSFKTPDKQNGVKWTLNVTGVGIIFRNRG